jgi:integrase
MARASKTDHVKKICGCAKWKDCAHPWYVDYREGKAVNSKGNAREKALRCKLAPLVGREPKDFADAKTEARRAIVAWKDGRDARELLPGDSPTLATVLDSYGQRPGGAAIDRYQRGPIVTTKVNGRAFGEWRAAEITREMVEAFRRQRPRVAGNRDLAVLRAAFNWSVLGGLVAATPFKVGTVSAVKLQREESRTRRLLPGEDERLLLEAKGLKDLIVAALETGCRKGELLSLQWHQVRSDLFLPAGKTKAKKPRRVPISTVLQAVLERRRNDPAGEALPSDAFVFGDEVGRRRGSIKTAWRLTCKRANIVGLNFHDLRREAGSRWMDAGVPLSTIQKWLGHHNISQTSTYLQATSGGDADAMKAFEQATGRLADPLTDGQVQQPANGLPQVAASAGSDGIEPTATDLLMSEKTQENAVVH